MKPIARRSLFALAAAAPVAAVGALMPAPAVGDAGGLALAEGFGPPIAPLQAYWAPLLPAKGWHVEAATWWLPDDGRLVMSDAELAATLGLP